jgi:hypothetical protein
MPKDSRADDDILFNMREAAYDLIAACVAVYSMAGCDYSD